MKLLALLTDGFGAKGGIARYNADLMTALATLPDMEIVILPRFGSLALQLPRGVKQLPACEGRVSWSVKALNLCRSEHFDVIVCGHLNALPLAVAAARLTSSVLWLQLHGIEAWMKRSNLYRWAIGRASLITAVSRYTRRQFLHWTDCDPGRVRVLPNTFGMTFGHRPKPPHLIERYKLSGKKVILTVGRLSRTERYKGHDRIIMALGEVLKAVPEALYVVAGVGDDRERLKALAVEKGVAEHVRFIGEVAEPELPDHFAMADVFAMPSTGEGFGIVFLEAVASGLPVIGGDRDGSADALADGALGTMIDPLDLGELEAALIAALSEPRKVPADGLDRFSRGNFTRHAHALLREVVRSAVLQQRSSMPGEVRS